MSRSTFLRRSFHDLAPALAAVAVGVTASAVADVLLGGPRRRPAPSQRREVGGVHRDRLRSYLDALPGVS